MNRMDQAFADERGQYRILRKGNKLSITLNLDARKNLAKDMKSRSSDVTFCMKFAIYMLGVGYGVSCSLSGNLALEVFGIILLGAMFAHGVELQHQVLHNQGFKKGIFNEIAGILVGLPMLVSFAGYQASHLRHHRLLGTKENKEFFDYGDQYGATRFATVLLWAKRFLMPAHYQGFLKNVFRGLFSRPVPGESPDVAKRIRRDHLIMLGSISALILISVATHIPVVLLAWVLPLVLVAAPMHALIEMPEHYRCDVNSTDVFKNTRTIKSNPFMTWFTNGNNFHVEHHLMPGLPIDRLHDLHATIVQNIPHLYESYREFYSDVFRNRIKNASENVSEKDQ